MMLPLDPPSTEAELIAYRRSLRDRMRDAAGPIPKAPPIDMEAVMAEGARRYAAGYRPFGHDGLGAAAEHYNRIRLRNED